ncbi:SIR2 family protein [Acinetobacter dispersus]|uniref:SIR2 family protein n=1 Tax=Acinetobacter dispersus TaxID=70348 RepID=UPI00039C0C43|nr:SIR2 family protein [Acinetobacter dispersus]
MIERLVTELDEGNLAIFAGAGLSIAAGYVDWKNLLKPLMLEIGIDVNKESDLVTLAQYYFNENGRSRLTDHILDNISGLREPTRNHQILASLPISTYWTTNYDNLIEKSLENENKLADVKHRVPHLAQTKKRRSAIVYKMHGDISASDEAIITKDEYELYPFKYAPFVTALSGDLISKTFLFLGFSFSDPNLDYILSRIRIHFSENQRQHYCLVKEIEKNGISDEEYDYQKLKLNLMIKDLKRFHIKAVLIKDWKDITEILEEIKTRYKKKSVFLSGSACVFNIWKQEETEKFLSKLGEMLIHKNYKIVSGLGLGIGNAFVSGGIKEVYSSKYGKIDDLMIMKPFPHHVEDKKMRDDIWHKYRLDLLSKSGIAIFFMGNKNESGSVVPAIGMRKEFAIAKEMKLKIVPIGCSGHVAKEIFDEIVNNFDEYYPDASSQFLEKFKELDIHVDSPEQLLSKILDVINFFN